MPVQFAALLVILSINQIGACENPQFCVQDDAFDLDLCLTASQKDLENRSLHLLFSGRFDRGTGWAAFGPGTKMDDTLMFLVYPSAFDEGEW
jgi:hypothetical protein